VFILYALYWGFSFTVNSMLVGYAWIMMAVGIDRFDRPLPPFDARQSKPR
jgi:hypothetical protein